MSDKVTFSELVKSISERNDITQQKAEKLVRTLFRMVLDDLKKDGKASITNFGSFSLKSVAERTGINPQTKEEIVIPAHNKVSFKPFKALETSVNAEYADLEPKLIGETPAKEEEPKQQVEETIVEPEAETANEVVEEDPFEAVINPDSMQETEAEEQNEEVEVTEEVKEENQQQAKEEATQPKKSTKEEKESSSAINLVLIVLVLLIAGTGIWYFFLKDTGNPTTPEKIVFNVPAPIEQPAEQAPVNVEQPTVQTPEYEEPKAVPIIQPEIEAGVKETASSTEATASTYTINRNDWFWVTAEKVYGQSALWPLIFEANFTVDTNPDMIKTGKIVTIPVIEGTASSLTKSDYAKLAKATKFASEAYANAGNMERSAEYLRFGNKYERLSKN